MVKNIAIVGHAGGISADILQRIVEASKIQSDVPPVIVIERNEMDHQIGELIRCIEPPEKFRWEPEPKPSLDWKRFGKPKKRKCK